MEKAEKDKEKKRAKQKLTEWENEWVEASQELRRARVIYRKNWKRQFAAANLKLACNEAME